MGYCPLLLESNIAYASESIALDNCSNTLNHSNLTQKAEMYAQKREKVRRRIMQSRFGLRAPTSVYIYNPHPKHFSPFFPGVSDLAYDGYPPLPYRKALIGGQLDDFA